MSALYIQKEGRQWGPFTADELQKQMEVGAFSEEDLYWTEGMEEWQPLATILAPNVGDEAEEVFFDQAGVRVTLDTLAWEKGELEPVLVAKSSATIEKVRRARPLTGGIVLGVLAVCVALAELPRTTATHWAIWAGVLLVMLFFTLRWLHAGLRRARSMVVIDMVDGSEYIIPTAPEVAQPLSDAIAQAAQASRQRVAAP